MSSDDEFGRLRTTLTDYRRQVQALVTSGKLDEVPLEVDSFRSYLKLQPFRRLNQRIAAVNQAELYPASLLPYISVFEEFGFTTLGDIDKFIAENSEEAYQLALSQLAFTDLDILSENVGLENLCLVYALKNGGFLSVKRFYDTLYGQQKENEQMAHIIMEQAASLPFMKKS